MRAETLRATRATVAVLSRSPGVLQARRWLHRSRFWAGRYHCGYSGVFRTFEDAAASIPPGMVGFDHEAMADLDHYRVGSDGFEPMPGTEYPALFWLRQAIGEGARSLLDVGGYVGHVYRQYASYLQYPDDFAWTVFDVPQITAVGAALAAADGVTQLGFTNDLASAAPVDILFAAGSLQYFPEGFLSARLRTAPRLPTHLILHRTPLHARQGFVTVQSIITRSGRVSFCPYTVARRQGVIDEVESLGYRLVDSWEKERSLDVPFHPECHVGTYSGLYFRRPF